MMVLVHTPYCTNFFYRCQVFLEVLWEREEKISVKFFKENTLLVYLLVI